VFDGKYPAKAFVVITFAHNFDQYAWRFWGTFIAAAFAVVFDDDDVIIAAFFRCTSRIRPFDSMFVADGGTAFIAFIISVHGARSGTFCHVNQFYLFQPADFKYDLFSACNADIPFLYQPLCGGLDFWTVSTGLNGDVSRM